MRRAVRAVLIAGIATLSFLALDPQAAAADGWADVGAAGRPAWVRASTERRLRLLPALPAIHDHLHTQANGYFRGEGPGLAVGLVLDDGLYYSEGFGFADAARKERPDEDTVFRAGSLSKVITGTGLLTLIDDPARHMSLDDAADAERYLPELKFVCPDFDQPCARGSQHLGIKLAHLVSHTSGLANVMEQTNAHVGVWLGDLKKSWLLFAPGQLAAYSGVGVEGVGLIEQRVSGKDYVDFIRDNLFTPLGMKRSSMDETTLPAPTRAQKWMFAGGYPTNSCANACTAAEGRCMDGAHGSGDRQACVREKQMCTDPCPHLEPTWSFSRFDERIAGDDQPMIAPAGGLATTVKDLSHFIEMWLSGQAPEVRGRPLLAPGTIHSAATPLFTATAAGPASCKDGRTDANGFSYSDCGPAKGFGVNWFVGNGYLEHNGDEPGVSGSNTRIDQGHDMGATGLVSTEPYPAFSPQPAGLDPHFMDTVVFGLLGSAEGADAATAWSGETLADGVARVLYLSGKEPRKDDLDAFTPGFIADHHLGEENVRSFLGDWQTRVGACHTFRVRDVSSATKIELVLTCEKGTWDAVLSVESQPPHRISWSEVGGPPAGPSASPLPDPHHAHCLTACTQQEGQCMSTAHGSAERQRCVKMMQLCKRECS